MKETFAIVATVFAILGTISYLRDVLAKKVRPHPYTWFVWTIVSGVTFFGQLAKGAGIGALPTGVAETFTLLIFLFSLQYGFKHVTKTDTYFLIFALFGLIPWIIFKDPTVSIIVVVTIDLIAFIPTLRKTRVDPSTEAPALYSMNVARHILTLFSLQTYNIATTLHSIAMIVTNSFMTFLILRNHKK
jgi:hypothetical protein